jgi:hypothetical protein
VNGGGSEQRPGATATAGTAITETGSPPRKWSAHDELDDGHDVGGGAKCGGSFNAANTTSGNVADFNTIVAR